MSDFENRIKLKLLGQLTKAMDDDDADNRKAGMMAALTTKQISPGDNPGDIEKAKEEKVDAVYLNPDRQRVMGEIDEEDKGQKNPMQGWGSFMRAKKKDDEEEL